MVESRTPRDVTDASLPDQAAAPFAGAAPALDPRPLIDGRSIWILWAGPVLSVLLIAAAAFQFRDLNFAGLWAMLPTASAFWIAFAMYYFMSPLTEWVIFRRLWGIPLSGFGALVRKQVSNEVLMGYLGELYFYAWARRNAEITAAPFGAIKDVTILSGLVGNLTTLIMVIAVAPLIGALHLGVHPWSIVGSVAVVMGSSFVFLWFRQRLFTLPRRELWIIAGLHLVRIVTTTMLAALMWYLLLPEVAISWWLLLGALRMLAFRLPLLPNKDVVFAGLASFLVGNEAGITAAMALMAALILTAHLVIGAILGASELAQKGLGR